MRVIVSEIALRGPLELVHQLIQVTLICLVFQSPPLQYFMQISRSLLCQFLPVLLTWHKVVKFEVLLYQTQKQPLFIAFPSVISLQNRPNRKNLLQNTLLLLADRLCLPVAMTHQLLVIPSQPALLGKGNQSIPQKHCHQRKSKGIGKCCKN